MDLSFIHGIVTMLQQHQPWIADKLGGTLVSQSLKELWEQVKGKLGNATAERVESKPDDAGNWDIFKAKLLVALDEDEAFREKVHALAVRSEQEAGRISQDATGTDIQQVAVDRSQGVNISVK
jgi:hypothetical protein